MKTKEFQKKVKNKNYHYPLPFIQRSLKDSIDQVLPETSISVAKLLEAWCKSLKLRPLLGSMKGNTFGGH